MTNELPIEGVTLRNANLARYGDNDDREVASADDANIICSDVPNNAGKHKVLIDIDLPIKVIPSSTPGHNHLYIDHEVTWDEYLRLVFVLADMGIVEEGYASATQERGYASLRLPWVHKDLCRCDQCEAETEEMIREEQQELREGPVVFQPLEEA